MNPITTTEEPTATRYCYACGAELPSERMILFLGNTAGTEVLITAMHGDGRCKFSDGPSLAWLEDAS